MKWVVIVTGPDGTQSVFGPFHFQDAAEMWADREREITGNDVLPTMLYDPDGDN
jgi:hypothetical protein